MYQRNLPQFTLWPTLWPMTLRLGAPAIFAWTALHLVPQITSVVAAHPIAPPLR